MADLIKRLRLLEQDHEPDGWPAVRMRDITALLDALEAAREDAHPDDAAVDEAKEADLWRCTVCGRFGTVGRCCGEETRERANVETLIAALEAARAEIAEARDGWHMANGTADLAMKHRDMAEARAERLDAELHDCQAALLIADARAERLAGALRDLLNIGDKFTGDPNEDAAIYCDVTDKARAALPQEDRND